MRNPYEQQSDAVKDGIKRAQQERAQQGGRVFLWIVVIGCVAVIALFALILAAGGGL